MRGCGRGDWRLIREECHDGAVNMALDAVAAETVTRGGPRTIRLYRWRPSTVSLGYHQQAPSIDWEYCADTGIDVTRRPTGGGGIYHDTMGDISYSIVVPADAMAGDLMDSYRQLCEPILDAFDRMGIRARFATIGQPALHEPACYLREIDPAHDVVVADSTRKISGNAQYRSRAAIIQHGSITYRRAVDRHLAVFTDHGVSAGRFRDRVTSIHAETGLDRPTALARLEAAFRAWVPTRTGSWSPAERRRAHALVARKFGNDRWTLDRDDPLRG